MPSATLPARELPGVRRVDVTTTAQARTRPIRRPLAMTETRDEELDAYLAAAIRGDRVAVDFILRAIGPLVVRYCRARLGRTERTFASADDVAREVCMAVLAALTSYRDQGKGFLAFVHGIAAQKVIDAYRTAGRNRSVLLDELPEKQRAILILRVVNGLSAEETAEAVGSTPGAVRVAQHRALDRLRELGLNGPADHS